MSPRALTAERVYPRVCGGTTYTSVHSGVTAGLSPRVRGNHMQWLAPKVDARSIPACAGEPVDGILALVEEEVYPRVCGGTPRHFVLLQP